MYQKLSVVGLSRLNFIDTTYRQSYLYHVIAYKLRSVNLYNKRIQYIFYVID